MELSNIKFIDKGAVYASFSVTIPQWHMTLNDCVAMRSGERRWVNLPSRQYTANDGSTKYFPYVWLEREAKDRFDKAVFEQLDKQAAAAQEAPSAFNFDEAPF